MSILLKANQEFNRENERAAILYLSQAYAMGSPFAALSLRNLIGEDFLGGYTTNDNKKATIFILDSFQLYRGFRIHTLLSSLADKVYYGVDFRGNSLEKYRNSYIMYKGAWKAKNDYYALYSLGFMEERGIGVERNYTNAIQSYIKTFYASFDGKISRGFLIPTLASIVLHYMRKVVRNLNFLSF